VTHCCDANGDILGGSLDGVAVAARFNLPDGIAVDSGGNLYVADSKNHTIRKLTLTGTNWVVTTLAGTAGSIGSADGAGADARFAGPGALSVDSAGMLYVLDVENGTIRKVTPNGMVTTLAGLTGLYGSADGPGSTARFTGPSAVAVDSGGNVYVADRVNHTIRKVTPAGELTTLAGLAGSGGYANGTGALARFDGPAGVAVDSAGNVYVADTFNFVVRKVTPTGVVTTLAGLATADADSVDGTGSNARFSYPHGVAVDSKGNVYVAESPYNSIRKVTPNGVVTTLAGPGGNGGTPGSADGIGSAARFLFPEAVAADSAGSVYVADTWNHTIRKITPARVVTTVAGQAGISGSADGIGTNARFSYPSGLAVDGYDNIYVADTFNNTIRKMRPVGTNWVVTTLGGLAGTVGSADGTGTAALFSNPNGVAVDRAGNLYVADYYLNTIRKGTPPLAITSSGQDFGFSGNQFGFDLRAPNGGSVVVESSKDLVSWLPLWTNTISGVLRFSDPQSGLLSKRFYRAHTQ